MEPPAAQGMMRVMVLPFSGKLIFAAGAAVGWVTGAFVGASVTSFGLGHAVHNSWGRVANAGSSRLHLRARLHLEADPPTLAGGNRGLWGCIAPWC